MLNLGFTSAGWEDYEWWEQNDKKLYKRLKSLLKEMRRTPYEGMGKPEELRHVDPGTWSRRLTDEHRLVYRVQDDFLIIIQCRYHY